MSHFISFHLIPWTIGEKQKVPTDATVTYLPSVVNKILTFLPANMPQVSLLSLVFHCAWIKNDELSADGTATSNSRILKGFNGLKTEVGLVLLSTLGNGTVLKCKIHADKCK